MFGVTDARHTKRPVSDPRVSRHRRLDIGPSSKIAADDVRGDEGTQRVTDRTLRA